MRFQQTRFLAALFIIVSVSLSVGVAGALELSKPPGSAPASAPGAKSPGAQSAPVSKTPVKVTPAASASKPADKASAAKPASPAASPAAPEALFPEVSPEKPVVQARPSQKLRLEIEPAKRIYSSREGLMVKFTFTALSKTKLCLDKDLLSQMQFSVFRPGTGKLQLQPLVVRDNSQIFAEPMQIRWLDSGESLTLRANLKRFKFANGEHWDPGEYNVSAVFHLCAQNASETVDASGPEIPVPTARQGWFMIMI